MAMDIIDGDNKGKNRFMRLSTGNGTLPASRSFGTYPLSIFRTPKVVLYVGGFSN